MFDDLGLLVQALLQYGKPQLVVEATGRRSRCQICDQGFAPRDKKLRVYVTPDWKPSFCPTGECSDWVLFLVRQMED